MEWNADDHAGELAIVASSLTRRFGAVTAVDGLDLGVAAGTVAALLGPNGSGKTTTVRVLTTLLKADGGTATVGGYDVARQPAAVRSIIGVTGQSATVDEVLTGRENLTLLAGLHHLDRRRARQRTGELLERFGLADAANRPVADYSGGMRRRLDLAASIVAEPAVLFLDEPTTGLDPQARVALWGMIRELAGSGTTVLLTTQYLDEADRLADQIVVLRAGRVVANDTPARLKARLGTGRLLIEVTDPADTARARALLTPATADTDRAGRFELPMVDTDDVRRTLNALHHADIDVASVELRAVSLDDVYLDLTGATT